MKKEKQKEVGLEDENDTPQFENFNRQELIFITQCVSEATIKGKDSAVVANILSKLKIEINGNDSE